jgi:hypothetical protein
MRCDELSEDRVAVLYGEADAAAERRVSEHSATCAACRDELSALRGVRRSLSAWKLPGTLRPKRPWRRAPLWSGWALPAAAALLISVGGGLALAGAELRYVNGELSLRLGREARGEVARLLEQQDERHRAELRALRAELVAAREPVPAPAAVDAPLEQQALLGQVQQLLAASENRQQTALRAAFDLMEQRRQYDMARVRTGFSYLEGRNGQDMANAMKVVSYVLAAQPGGADLSRPH